MLSSKPPSAMIEEILAPGLIPRTVKKRTTLFDNEVQREQCAAGQQGQTFHYGDRFIPRRSSMASVTQNLNKINARTPSTTSGEKSKRLASALGLRSTRQMSLTDPAVPRLFFRLNGMRDTEENFYFYPEKNTYLSPRRYKDLDWLCRPRGKPLIDAHSSHEFEGFCGTAVGNLIEWAWTGQLIAYYEDSLLLWNPNEEVITKYELMDVITLAYHPFNSSLATSNRHKAKHSVNVWAFERGNMRNCFSYRSKLGGPITSLCWHRHGIHLLCGNARGVIITLDIYAAKKARINQTSSAMHKMIKDLKFSASGRYLASLDILGKLCIWYYNSGYLLLQQEIKDPRLSSISCIDWHPWSNFDLALCLRQGKIILILNILSKKAEAYSHVSSLNHKNPVISFNKITAELLVSCHRVVENVIQKSILVLGAIDRIVDEIPKADYLITNFMWSPNNEHLAFIEGNNIQIFNFFGTTAPPRQATNSVNLAENSSIFKQFDFIK